MATKQPTKKAAAKKQSPVKAVTPKKPTVKAAQPKAALLPVSVKCIDTRNITYVNGIEKQANRVINKELDVVSKRTVKTYAVFVGEKQQTNLFGEQNSCKGWADGIRANMIAQVSIYKESHYKTEAEAVELTNAKYL